ncbi:hypothetical protein E0Z10_g9425 [Xylaria hypoxylon]|uniref:DUF7580 domain-containing protein n=1 Tax=Xylaria hypoxylon TaxID=37992 RepID=A0A4Z0YJ47_9PEZI|nr:hypothetical protein E0Z10_g9425 [Xylaria hypoxylon]
MSGFEIAGLILGAYPILYDTAKDLRGALKKTKAWWFFERTFDDFVSEVQKEYVSFSQILEILLDPLDLSSDERRRLQDEPNCSLWHEAHVQDQLRQRIQPKYHVWFMGQLEEMNTALAELHAMLPIDKIYILDSTSVEATLFKFKRSFSNKKDVLLATVRSKNDALFHFLEKASHITQSASVTVSSKLRARVSLRRVSFLQDHSQRAFKFLRDRWTCSCPQHHHCGIAIEHHENTPSLSLLLSGKGDIARIKVVFDMVLSKPEQTIHEEVTILKQQMSLKRTLRNLKFRRSQSTLALGISALSLVSNPFSSERNKVRLEKDERKLKKKAPVSMTNPKLPPIPSQEGNVVSPLTTHPQIPGQPRRQVRFAEEHAGVSASPSIASKGHIDNICEIVDRSILESYDACEEIGQDTRMFLQTGPQVRQPLQQTTVEAFIAATPRRDKRMHVALVILRSMLCLGPSSWIPPSWNKSHLTLISDNTSDTQPYFFQSSLLSDPLSLGTPAPQSDQTRASLFSIGVLLLELLFRETFEKQPFRAQFLNNMGQANEVTDLCAALQWHQRVGEECGYELSDAIRRCIVCAFDAPHNPGDPEFIEAVWYGVVQPLENFLSAWNNNIGKNFAGGFL